MRTLIRLSQAGVLPCLTWRKPGAPGRPAFDFPLVSSEQFPQQRATVDARQGQQRETGAGIA